MASCSLVKNWIEAHSVSTAGAKTVSGNHEDEDGRTTLVDQHVGAHVRARGVEHDGVLLHAPQ